MKEVYIGIDPGAKGFMCLQVCGHSEIRYIPLRDGKEVNPEIRKTLESIVVDFKDIIACVEQVHAMPGQGRTSIFTFGVNYGYILGILHAYAIPVVHVPPMVWQREMWTAPDKVRTADGKINTKQTSYLAARRLHPTLTFRRNERCKNFDDNMVDATLICDYAIRKNL